jgi:hypothetical protein
MFNFPLATSYHFQFAMLSPCHTWSGIMEIIRGDTYVTCYGLFITNLRCSCLDVRTDIALTTSSLINSPHFSMTMFPCSLHVHALLVHHRNRILYTSHHGWASIPFVGDLHHFQFHVQFSIGNITPLSICDALASLHMMWNFGDY